VLIERLVGRSGILDASNSLQSIIPFVLYLFVFSLTWKESPEFLMFTYNMLPEFTSIAYKMEIIHDGMGLFMPTSRFHSLSIALKYGCVDHLGVLC
jgi:hypothetical protein